MRSLANVKLATNEFIKSKWLQIGVISSVSTFTCQGTFTRPHNHLYTERNRSQLSHLPSVVQKHANVSYLEFGTQTLPVRSLDTETKAPSGKTADTSPLTSISWPGMEHRSLYELDDAIMPRKHNETTTVEMCQEAICQQTPLTLAEVQLRHWSRHSN